MTNKNIINDFLNECNSLYYASKLDKQILQEKFKQLYKKLCEQLVFSLRHNITDYNFNIIFNFKKKNDLRLIHYAQDKKNDSPSKAYNLYNRYNGYVEQIQKNDPTFIPFYFHSYFDNTRIEKVISKIQNEEIVFTLDIEGKEKFNESDITGFDVFKELIEAVLRNNVSNSFTNYSTNKNDNLKTPHSFCCWNLSIHNYDYVGSLMVEFLDEKYPEAISKIDEKIHEIREQFLALKLAELQASNLISQLQIRKETIKSAIAAIMSRNMSHNLGSHVISGTKNYLANKNFQINDNGIEKGVYRLFQYLQERMDFISVIINSNHNGYSFYAPLNLKADILDEIAADGRDKRHGCEGNETKSFLLENVVKSEDIYRDVIESGKKLEIVLLRKMKDGKIRSFTSESNGDNFTKDFNDINFSIPFGINSRHAFLTIIENYIRNSAKHNKNYPQGVDTLLVSIMVEEKTIEDKNNNKIEGYEITIFDNKNVSKEKGKEQKHLDELDNKLKSIKILDDENTLDTSNKGFKEMLICAAWLKDEYADWSVIEGKSEKQYNLLRFCTVDLDSDIISKWDDDHKIEISGEHRQRMEEDRKKKKKAYTNNITSFGIRLRIPKHTLIHYAEITNEDDIYDFPSADYYALKVNGNVDLKEKIKRILSNVIFVENATVIPKGAIEQRSFIVKELKKNNENLGNTEIVVLYQKDHHPQVKGDSGKYEISKDVCRIFETDCLPTFNSKVCIFNRHNDTPETFNDTYKKFNNKYSNPNNSDNRLQFIEGISGGSYNYNLLMNASLDSLDKIKVIQSCYAKIAIIDERIYEKYSSQIIGDGGLTIANMNTFNKEIIEFREGKKQDISRDCNNYIEKYITKGDDRKQKVENRKKWLASCELISFNNFMGKWLKMKRIFIYNCIESDNGYKLIDIEGNRLDGLPADIEYLSTHYGIIQKIERDIENSNGIVSAYKEFLEKMEVGKQCEITIHSGRGGVVDKQKEVTFIPLSTIEAQLEDCKYKLFQLFANLKYKPIVK